MLTCGGDVFLKVVLVVFKSGLNYYKLSKFHEKIQIMNNKFFLIAEKYFPLFAFCLCIFLFWPGLMRSDSFVQMQQGLNGWVSSDFHPPVMGIVWRLFSGIYKGPGVLFVLHAALYWGAVALFAKTQISRAYVVYVIAFLPPIYAYQLLIVKDVSFVNAYLFCASWLHFYSLRHISPKPLAILGWFVIAFYGTCAAYQAIIALPWLCLWFSRVYWSEKTAKWIRKGLVLTTLMASSVVLFNYSLTVPSHRAQHNKLYDLAGISINLGTAVFPEYIKQYKFYDFERIKKLYNPHRVDDLTFLSDSPIFVSSSEDDLRILNSAWLSAIFSYPKAYLKHRWDVFYQQLTVSLLKKPNNIKEFVTPLIVKILEWVEFAGIFTFFKWLMSYIAYFFIQCIFLYKGFRHFKDDPAYVHLFFQNVMGVSLVLSLFFIAGAAEARYAYLAIAMFYFSLPLFAKKGLPT